MHETVTVAMFSVDPPGLSTFHAFDPESFTLVSVIHDGLIYVDNEGAVQPALATSWRRISPLQLELTLRRGVRFHNGEPFDASSVVATFHAHKHPGPSAAALGALGAIASATRVDDFTVRIETTFPDAMLVRRLFLSSMYPRGVLERHGRDYFATHPIGTGPYRFVSYEAGREIVLERNAQHWSGKATVDRLRLPILRQKEWVTRLERGEIDVALGIDSHDRVRAGRIPGLHAESRQAAITQWFLLSNRGPLADVRVRRAMNHAINRRLLTDIAEHGYGVPQRSIATEGQQGYTVCEPYRYSPELARMLLDEAGFASGIALRGLVSETSTEVYFTTKEFLARVGVALEAEIVPRAEWIRRVVGGNLRGAPYDGDFAIAVFDNPILHSLFHHFIFLYSRGPFSLLRDAAYDAELVKTATTFADAEADQAQAALERYARDNALVVFTVHEDVHAAWRDGFSCELPRSGHFQVDALMSLRATGAGVPARSLPPPPAAGDAAVLLDATSHAGAFFLRPDARFDQPVMQRIWDNLRISEQRWSLHNEPMLRELVSQVEAKASLANVLGSTERVAIVGHSTEWSRLFVNAGYEAMFGADARPVFEHLGAQWEAIRAQLVQSGSWQGPVMLTTEGRPAGAPARLYLSVTVAHDGDGTPMGYTFVFSDFSGEEERIRHQAIRKILDNVPYGLFMCDADGVVLDGYSDACTRFFIGAEAGIHGRSLTALLAMDARTGDHLLIGLRQIFDDYMPEEVSLASLPRRIAAGARTFALSGSIVRGDRTGKVVAVLFTLLDISTLIDAEHEIAALRGTLQVARYRDRFEELARQLHARLCELADAAPGERREQVARIELHTAKAVFAQFSLHELADQIHAIEGKPTITETDLIAVDAGLRALVERNLAIWGIQLEAHDACYTATETALARLEARIAAAGSLADARRALTEGLDDIRRKPVGELLGPIEECCTQLATRCGKQVRLVIEGADIRWPVRLAKVFDVLPHLLRNSIDHGIEPLEQRIGKDEVASIRLRVRAADRLLISVADDGRGINVGCVGRRAIELGAITEAQLATMASADRLNLIFVAGLSTAERASETSGRGIGMAAVQRAIEALGGTLSVTSDPGRGTEVQIAFARVCGGQSGDWQE